MRTTTVKIAVTFALMLAGAMSYAGKAEKMLYEDITKSNG